jgi:hypothetical protein
MWLLHDQHVDLYVGDNTNVDLHFGDNTDQVI